MYTGQTPYRHRRKRASTARRANGPRPPAVDVASDGIRCVLRTALPTAGMQRNKRPVFVKVTRFDPAVGWRRAVQDPRAREHDLRPLAHDGYDYHVEVENTTGDAMCVEVARYPGLGAHLYGGAGVVGLDCVVHADGAAVRGGEAGDSEWQPGRGGQRRHAADQRLRFAGEPDSGSTARQHLRLRYGGQPVHPFLHHDRERGQDEEQLVIRGGPVRNRRSDLSATQQRKPAGCLGSAVGCRGDVRLLHFSREGIYTGRGLVPRSHPSSFKGLNMRLER